MKLLTPVSVPVADVSLTYDHRVLTLGSCFSDNLARKMGEYYFRVIANPVGTLYNPVSIAHHVDDFAPDADWIMITFGTSWVYEDRALMSSPDDVLDAASVVDNCQKRPASDFVRRRLTVDDILSLWRPVLLRYPDKVFVFTVSPIRHVKDGLHENQISKSILLQAVDDLVAFASAHSLHASYFPSYEILLDELRDYRFYADDLVHPSTMAVNYIWERFVDTYISKTTQSQMTELHQLYLDRNHRLLNPDSPESLAFIQHLRNTEAELSQRYPWL